MDYYLMNIEALRQYQPHLINRVETTEDNACTTRLQVSDRGEPRLIWKGEDGQEFDMYNVDDPAQSARQAIELMDKSEKEGVFVLLGFGLGYLTEELLKHFETGHAMLIYEATPLLFKNALRARDLSKIFASEKVKLIVGEKADDFSIIHQYNHHLVNGRLWLIAHRPSVRLNEPAYATFRERLDEEKRISLSNVGTVISLGKEFINSFLENVPTILQSPGVACLKNLFEGRPAIIVSAGPSLEKNIHLLKKAKSKALIVAVDAALPTLVLSGILPDVLVAIDPISANVGMFKDNPHLKDIPFVCLSQYTPEMVKIYPGPLFMNMTEGNIVYQWLRRYWEEKGCVACFGGSVSHLGFALAEHMGASTICLIGLDLSFEEKLHAGETTKLLFPGEQKVPDFRVGAQAVQDIFGEKRFSLDSYLTFKTSFENRIKTFTGRVFNATEGGLQVIGAENIRLADFIAEFCDLTSIDTFSLFCQHRPNDVMYDITGLLQEVRSAKEVLINIRNNAKRILTLIKSLMKMKKSKREGEDLFQKTVEEIESLTEKVRHPALNMIASYHYQLELYLKRQAVQDIDDIKDKYRRLDEQLQRGLNYYGELLKALPLFLQELSRLQQTLGTMDKTNRLLEDTSVPLLHRLKTAAAIYQKLGMSRKAVSCMEAALSRTNLIVKADNKREQDRLGQEYRTLYISLAEEYIKQFRYGEAREILQKAGGHSRLAIGVTSDSGDQRKIDALLEVCDKKIEAWKERKLKTAAALEQAEATYGTTLESGFFYFRSGSYERSEKAYLRALQEHSDGKLPELVAAHYGLAHTYLKLKQHQRAVDAFAAALEMDPGNALIYRDLALLAIENGNPQTAEMFLNKALELAPWSDELYVFLARLYLSLNETEKAVALYEYGIRRNPENASLKRELALLYQDVIIQQNREGSSR